MEALDAKLSRFLESQDNQPEAGLIILETADPTNLLSVLDRYAYYLTSRWETALTLLEHGQSVALLVDRYCSRETYDIIAQYRARLGTVQIFDKRSAAWVCATCDPESTHLILIVTQDDLSDLSRRMDLLNKVGISERF